MRATESRADARSRMIAVAERLFAEQGIDAVSLRTVGQAAGQRNNSAAQYHFGSRQGLVQAIIDHRSGDIDAHRGRLLDEIELSGTVSDLGALVEVFVRPLADAVGTQQAPTWYLRFLARVVEQDGGLPALEADARPETLRRLERLMRGLLPDVDRRTYVRRQRWLAQITIRALADQEAQIAAGRRAAARDRVVSDLVAMLVALLTAP